MRSLRETTASQLAAYRSVLRCLEEHKLDASPLSNFRIEENISKLERELLKLDQKLREMMMAKRKAEGLELVGEMKAAPPMMKRQFLAPAEQPPSRAPTLPQDHAMALPIIPGDLYDGFSNRGGVDAAFGSTAGFYSGGGGGGYSSVGGGNGIQSYHQRWYPGGASGDSRLGHEYAGRMGAPSAHRGPAPPPLPPRQLAEPSLLVSSSPGMMGSRAGGSSLYGFGDSVAENELYYRSARSSVQSNPTAGYHHPSPY